MDSKLFQCRITLEGFRLSTNCELVLAQIDTPFGSDVYAKESRLTCAYTRVHELEKFN